MGVPSTAGYAGCSQNILRMTQGILIREALRILKEGGDDVYPLAADRFYCPVL